MKYLVLAVFFVAMQASQPAPREAAQNHSAENKKQSNSRRADENPTPNRSVVQPDNPQATTPNATKRDDHKIASADPPEPISVKPVSVAKDIWDYFAIGATVVLTVITLILAILAKISADIASNAQRSWVICTGVENPDFKNAWIQRIPCKFKVYGSRPIRIVESNFRVRLVNARITDERKGIREPDLPRTPDYSKPDTLENQPEMGPIRAPEEEFEAVPVLESMFLYEAGTDKISGAENVAAIKEGKKFLCAYGFVRYREAYSRSKRRETRFCYVYGKRYPLGRSDEFITGGPPSYNEAT